MTPDRSGTIDLAKFIGAVAIVAFHKGASDLALAALPMFVILLVYFAADRPATETARRLLVPWLVASVIYAALKICQAMVNGDPISNEFAPWMLFAGPAIHLWFLPFCALFLVTCRRLPAAALVALSVASMWIGDAVPAPFVQWTSVIPAACAGLMMQNNPRRVLVAFMAAMLAANGLGWTHGTAQMALGGAVVLLCLLCPVPSWSTSRALADLSLGVYLSHPAVIALLPGAPLLTVIIASGLVTLGFKWAGTRSRQSCPRPSL